MTTENRLSKPSISKEPMELNEEIGRKYLASAIHYGHPEAAKKWREYLASIHADARIGER
jgi:heme oxygenase